MPILAIDQGTTSTRAMRVDDNGKFEITAVIRHAQHYPRDGWVEHDPEELIASIENCIQSTPDVSAIGIDNQGESCLAWHADSKQAVSPVIVWQDNRTHDVIEHLKLDGHEARVLEISGLPLDSYFSASKLAWILENCEDARTLHQQGKLRMGTTDAYFLDRLGGHFVTDITTASRTSLLNLQTGQWDDELCELFGVPIEVLPEIVATTGKLGEITTPSGNVMVTASVVDQQASLYGHGCRKPGDAKITFGTGAFALALTGDQPLRSPEQGLLPTIAWQKDQSPPLYALDGGVYCAGSAVEWGKNLGLFTDYEQINQFDKTTAIERGLVFIPALSGLACPHWDRHAVGIWRGMSLATSPLDLAQSILEGVALRASEVIQAMSEFTAVGDSISIDGGLTANPYFCQFLANTLDRQVSVKPLAELTAIGTAQLAGASEIKFSSDQANEHHYQPRANYSEYRELYDRAIRFARDC